MRKTLLLIAALAATIFTAEAAESTDTIRIAYNGTQATVTIPSGVGSVVKCTSGTSSYVVLTQGATETEYVYLLSGTSTDGGFSLTGTYKTTLVLSGLTLTSTQGAALAIQNGKRIKVKMPEGTESTLTDCANGSQKGCLSVSGHTEFRGKGTLNVTGKTGHAVRSGEYISVKNCTINILSAVKDGFNCNEYFWIESGNINVVSAGDDGIQVDDDDQSALTAILTDHEEENTGNFYAEAATDAAGIVGTITIDGFDGKAIKTVGGVYLDDHFMYHFDRSKIKEDTPNAVTAARLDDDGPAGWYDLNGRRLPHSAQLAKGVYLVRENGQTKKCFVK